jgi:MOSC domain-containing protein YiiM
VIPLAELRRSFAGPGRVEWIGLRSVRKGPLTPVSRVDVSDDGLAGDHGRPGKRAVTLIQAEHFPVIATLCGVDSVAPAVLRRNLVISGINLRALREFGIAIGDIRLEITAPCAPCSRMEAALGPGGYSALRGHGGWCCRVVTGGILRLGDSIHPD